VQTFQVETWLGYQRPLAFTPDSRFLAVAAKAFTFIDTTGGPERTFPDLGYIGRGDQVALVGAAVVSMAGNTNLKVFRSDTGDRRRLALRCGYTISLAAKPNSETVFVSVGVYGGSHSIRSVHLTDTKQRTAFAEMKHSVRRLTVSGDGRWLAGERANTLRVWNVGGPKLPSRSSLSVKMTIGVNDFALSSDGSHLAAVDDHVLHVWDTKRGTHARSARHRSPVTAVACHPTRPVLVTGDQAGKIFLWSYNCRVLTRYNWELSNVRGLAFAPDGLRCAAIGGKGAMVIWDVDA
jgi:WD40 repeat protein